MKLQVIFPALDIRVKNVARTYSLEHKGESDLFEVLFELLNSNVEDGDVFRRELASCTGVIHTSLSQHMEKEEEQVRILYFVLFYMRSISFYMNFVESDMGKFFNDSS